jgi:hypothetical protein
MLVALAFAAVLDVGDAHYFEALICHSGAIQTSIVVSVIRYHQLHCQSQRKRGLVTALASQKKYQSGYGAQRQR